VRRAILICLCLAAVLPAAAFAKGYGHGTFTGTVTGSKSGSSADVTLKVKGKKITVTAVLHLNDCAGTGTGITDVTGSLPPRKIHKGPAGGGFSSQGTIRGETPNGPIEVDVSLAGGIRTKTIRSTFDAYTTGYTFSCSLSGDLKAKK
jgi:hypothetical protein